METYAHISTILFLQLFEIIIFLLFSFILIIKLILISNDLKSIGEQFLFQLLFL